MDYVDLYNFPFNRFGVQAGCLVIRTAVGVVTPRFPTKIVDHSDGKIGLLSSNPKKIGLGWGIHYPEDLQLDEDGLLEAKELPYRLFALTSGGWVVIKTASGLVCLNAPSLKVNPLARLKPMPKGTYIEMRFKEGS